MVNLYLSTFLCRFMSLGTLALQQNFTKDLPGLNQEGFPPKYIHIRVPLRIVDAFFILQLPEIIVLSKKYASKGRCQKHQFLQGGTETSTNISLKKCYNRTKIIIYLRGFMHLVIQYGGDGCSHKACGDVCCVGWSHKDNWNLLVILSLPRTCHNAG